MNRSLVLFSVLAVGVAGACKSKSAAPSGELATPEATAASTGAAGGDVFAAAGTEGSFAVAVWPEHWSSVRASAKALASGQALAPIEGILSSYDSAWSALAAGVAATMGLELPAAAPASLDGTRPIVMSLAAPLMPYEELALAVAEAVQAGKPAPQPGLRHRVVLPAVDAEALAGELRAIATAELAPVSGRADEYRGGAIWLRLETGPSWVAVDLVTDRGESEAAPAPAAPRYEPSAADRVFGRAGDSAVRLRVRLDGLEELAPYWGMNHVARAVGAVEPEYLRPILTQGVSEVLVSTVAIDPSAAVSRSVLAELGTDGAPPSAAFFVTEAGARTFAADEGLASGEEVAVDAVDWLAVAKKAPVSAWLEKTSSPDDVARAFHQCGFACSIDGAGGNGLALVALLVAKEEGSVDVPAMLAMVEPAIGFELGTRLDGGLLLVGARGKLDAMAGLEVEPSKARPRSAAAACFASYRIGLVKGLGAMSSMPPEQRGMLFARLESEVAADRACAAKDAAIAPRVAAIEKLVAILRG